MVLIIITAICGILFAVILIDAYKDARDHPQTWEDLHLSHRIDKEIIILLKEWQRKQHKN